MKKIKLIDILREIKINDPLKPIVGNKYTIWFYDEWVTGKKFLGIEDSLYWFQVSSNTSIGYGESDLKDKVKLG